MKGAVASFVTAAAALSRSGFQPAADIVLAITCGEEAGMLGAAAMVDRRSLEGSRYLVVGEATQLDVVIGEKGVLWVHVRAIGRTAHGSMPDLGVNAVSTIARLIPRLEEYPFPFEESALLGKPTLSVNIIGGGNKTNVVPDSCEIAIDMRTVPGQDHEAIIRQLREMADEVARDYHSEARIEIEIENDKQALETAPDDSLVGATIESVRSILGRDPAVRGVTYGTDAAHLGPGFNIPMVICGPGEPGQLHQPDENIEVDQLVQAAQIYTDLAQRLVG
jgi:succinyl-diaminopimelate desuccinylase